MRSLIICLLVLSLIFSMNAYARDQECPDETTFYIATTVVAPDSKALDDPDTVNAVSGNGLVAADLCKSHCEKVEGCKADVENVTDIKKNKAYTFDLYNVQVDGTSLTATDAKEKRYLCTDKNTARGDKNKPHITDNGVYVIWSCSCNKDAESYSSADFSPQ